MNGLLLAGLLAIQPITVTAYVEAGVTASGVYTHPGTVACPPALDFGQQVVIDGLGTYTCEDSYSRALGPRFDVWVADRATAFALTGRYTWRLADTD